MKSETKDALEQTYRYLRWLTGSSSGVIRVREQDQLTAEGCDAAKEVIRELIDADQDTPEVAEPPPIEPPSGFQVFNALLNLEHEPVIPGPTRMTVIYEGRFGLGPHGVVSDAGFEQAAADVATQRGIEKWSNDNGMIGIDIESRKLWPWVLGQQHQDSVDFYVNIARRMKERFPDEKIGLYNVFPIGGISIAQQIQKNPTKRQQFTDANRIAAEGIKPYVDYLSPSFYSFYPSKTPSMVQYRIDEWKQGVDEHMALAREFLPGVPVYPYIWPQYHTLHTMVEPEIWSAQLEHIKEVCDGVILWGMLKSDGSGVEPAWDNDAQWWETAKTVFGITQNG